MSDIYRRHLENVLQLEGKTNISEHNYSDDSINFIRRYTPNKIIDLVFGKYPDDHRGVDTDSSDLGTLVRSTLKNECQKEY